MELAMEKIQSYLSEYNAVIKETNGLYRDTAKLLGVSDSVFWILYVLRESDKQLMQRDIVKANSFPPQTINSALKKMEKDGLVELIEAKDKRKKQVILTDKGVKFAENTVDAVSALEIKAMGSLSQTERKNFIELLRKYTDCLKINLESIKGDNKK